MEDIGEGITKKAMFEFNLKRQEGIWTIVKGDKTNTPGCWASRSKDRDTENKWFGGDQQITLWLECRGGEKTHGTAGKVQLREL